MKPSRVAFVVAAVTAAFTVLLGGCGAHPADESGESSGEGEPTGTSSANEALSSISCAEHSAQGYSHGTPMGIGVVTIDGKPVEVHTADAYYVMAQAAARAGINLAIVSGFRTMAEQQYLYGCYIHCSCNGCALAAVPGYSNHQSGHAVDLNTSAPGVYAWLEAHAASFGFHRTVPSEAWHWEWWGGGPGGGPCAGGGQPPPSGGGGGTGCHSDTLGADVANNACVQSRYDQKWYQCDSGHWVDRFTDPTACSSVHPL